MAFARWREVVVAEKDILVEQGGVAAKERRGLAYAYLHILLARTRRSSSTAHINGCIGLSMD
jgi:hypothetical protein